MKNLTNWILLICTAISLTGCFDLDQQVTLVKDELTYKAELKLDAKLVALSNKKQNICDEYGTVRPDGIIVDVKESAANGNIICTITAKGNIEKFDGFKNSQDEKSGLVRFTKIDKSKYRIESIMDFNSKKTDAAGMDGMLEAMFAGRKLSWSISAPKIIESNGEIAKDGKSVSWSVPLSVAFKNSQNFYAVIENDVSWFQSILDFFKKIFISIKSIFSSSPSTVDTAKKLEPVNKVKPAQNAAELTQTQTQVAQDNNPFAPSFDCAKASTGQERLICSDRELSKLDVEMSNAYRNARQKSANAQALKTEQIEWIKNTQRACSDKNCLAAEYKARIAELSK